ncbi:hypothetical protein PAXRUDRAFT_364872 [Paxillus rubicundulus Ve08.2h10]|uniref:Uncharacterized protein n=1 Tax=Paxillus rubicundulus Ve08.2h10 TaxID=930991 RepID=A0A0D0DE58_9AGAM|nr:hypothetical protein PAXRUDRAFT_364872 [Paxillus rubicundulus Ve08.2h10]
MSNASEKSVDLTGSAKPLTTMSGREVTYLGYSLPARGERVVSCSEDKTVRIWDVESGKQQGTPMEHKGWLESLALPRDGGRIVSGGGDSKIHVWDVETQETVEEWRGHANAIQCIAMSPDGQPGASGDVDGEIMIRADEGGRRNRTFS